MKKVLILDSGLKPGWTSRTAEMIADRIKGTGFMSAEILSIREQDIRQCAGCAVCLDRGEEKCKHYSDSVKSIIEKMEEANGIITVTPNYSMQVPWNLKNLYDRLAYVFHRPRLFHKPSMAIVIQGVYGGDGVVKYIDKLMTFWGCIVIKGAVLSGGLYPNSRLSENTHIRNEKILFKALCRFKKAMAETRYKRPSIFRVAIFSMTRTSMKYSPDALPADKDYFYQKGWMESKYYYDIKLGPIKSLIGSMFDNMIKGMIEKEGKKAEKIF